MSIVYSSFSLSSSWTTDDSLSNHLILSCVGNRGELRRRLSADCNAIVVVVYLFPWGVKEVAKPEKSKRIERAEKKTKDLMKIDSRTDVFCSSPLSLSRSLFLRPNAKIGSINIIGYRSSSKGWISPTWFPKNQSKKTKKFDQRNEIDLWAAYERDSGKANDGQLCMVPAKVLSCERKSNEMTKER